MVIELKRKIYSTLLNWKENKNKKPIMIIGARQIGKTYIVNKFCKNEYKDYIYLNFDKNEELTSIFDGTKDPKEIIQRIEAHLARKIDVRSTVIFFDEIQISERAINSLKYFCEAEEKYNIICAGSLLRSKA